MNPRPWPDLNIRGIKFREFPRNFGAPAPTTGHPRNQVSKQAQLLGFGGHHAQLDSADVGSAGDFTTGGRSGPTYRSPPGPNLIPRM
jgi:hypothetical protein